MPISPEQIASAGPWAVLVAVLVAIGAAAWFAFIRDIVVSGKRLRQSERRNLKLEAELRRVRLKREQDADTVLKAARLLASRSDDRALSVERDPQGFHD